MFDDDGYAMCDRAKKHGLDGHFAECTLGKQLFAECIYTNTRRISHFYFFCFHFAECSLFCQVSLQKHLAKT